MSRTVSRSIPYPISSTAKPRNLLAPGSTGSMLSCGSICKTGGRFRSGVRHRLSSFPHGAPRLANMCGVVKDQLRRCDVLNRNPDGFEHSRCRCPCLLCSGKYFTNLSVYLSLGKNYVPGFGEDRIAGIDNEGIGHRGIVEL